jgi:hypothetical protein
MMATWDKGVALSIIQAGFIRLTKKFHPDAGGSHEEMLILTATKEHLEKFIAGGGSHSTSSFTYQRARQEPPRRRRPTYRGSQEYWDDIYNPDIPLEPYEADNQYVQLIDVTIMSVTEKAFKIKISGVQMPQWLPKSQMLHTDFDLDKVVEGDVLTLVFTKWIARQKGWMK